MNGPEAVAALFQLLDEPTLRAQAAVALVSRRPLPGDAIERILALKDPSIRGSLLMQVPSLLKVVAAPAGETLFQFTLEALTDPTPWIRSNALEVLAVFGPRPEAVPSVTQLLESTDLMVQIAAIRALTAWGPSAASALPQLRKLSGLDPAREVLVLQAIDAIDFAEAARSVPQLRRLFSDPHLAESERNAVLKLLLRTPEKPTGRALVALLSAEKQPYVRTTLALAIDAEDPIEPSAIPELGAMLRGDKDKYGDPSPAGHALTKSGHPGRVELMSCLNPKRPLRSDLWGPVMGALAAVTPANADELIPQFLAYFEAAPPGQGRNMAMGLIRQSGPAAVPHIERWLALDARRKEGAIALLNPIGSQESVDALERIKR